MTKNNGTGCHTKIFGGLNLMPTFSRFDTIPAHTHTHRANVRWIRGQSACDARDGPVSHQMVCIGGGAERWLASATFQRVITRHRRPSVRRRRSGASITRCTDQPAIVRGVGVAPTSTNQNRRRIFVKKPSSSCGHHIASQTS